MCGSTSPILSLVAFCEGKQILIPQQIEGAAASRKLPLTVEMPQVTVQVLQPPPSESREEKPFRNRVVVRILNTQGQGVSGKRVVAMLSVSAGAEVAGYAHLWDSHQVFQQDGRKRIRFPVSGTTNVTGHAVFSSTMRLTASGLSGQYAWRFLCDGAASPPHNMLVTSSVSDVSLMALNPVDAFGFAAETNILDPQPVLRITDEMGNGIAGKVVSASFGVNASDVTASVQWEVPGNIGSRV